MNKKQIYKIADKIIELEKIVSDTSESEERRARAEKEISKYAGMIICLPDGLAVMSEIDEIILKRLEKK